MPILKNTASKSGQIFEFKERISWEAWLSGMEYAYDQFGQKE
jgi:hypothetical protein